MSFYPAKGTITIDNFNSTEGTIFNYPSLQGIRGGYITLLNTNSGYSTIDKNWKIINSWDLEDQFISVNSLTGVYKIYTGNIDGLVNTISGFVGIETNTTALSIITEYPDYISGYGYSGKGVYGISLSEFSPNVGVVNNFSNGAEKLTIEVDVASLSSYSGLNTLQGYNVNQNNFTGLEPLSGLIGHGILLSNGAYWDFIEVTPYGLRSFNHPEIALPLNLQSPKRIRIGINGTNIYLAAEDGSTIAGYNKFTTELSDAGEGIIFIGAPSNDISDISDMGIFSNTEVSYGHTMWDNLKILYGEMAIYNEDSIDVNYSTGFVSMFTSSFNPGMAIDRFLNAKINYIPLLGGITKVTAQYSGVTGWIDNAQVTLGTNLVENLDLSTIPIYNYPRSNGGTDYLYNPVRFKVEQRSYLGTSLPPTIDSIELVIDKERTQIDLVPDWKPSNATVKVKVGLDTGTYTQEDPIPDIWTNFLMNVPATTGVIQGTGFIDEAKSLSVVIQGTGEIFQDGPYQYCLQNYTNTSLTAVSGSDAYNVFGNSPVKNLYPNPFFGLPFRQIGTGEANYKTGLVNGQLSEYVYIPDTYTGTFKVDYLQEAVFRPENQARANRIKQYLGQQSSSNEEYVQSVYVYPSIYSHQGNVGLNLQVPNGIATGDLDVTFDLVIEKGRSLTLELSGSSLKQYYIPGDYYRTFTPVSVKTHTTNNDLSINLYVTSGQPGEEYKFSVDNLTVSPYSTSYIKTTGIYVNPHSVGLTELSGLYPSTNLSISLSTEIYLDSYPETNGTLLSLFNQGTNGISISMDRYGYLSGYINLLCESIDSYGNIQFTGNFKSIKPFPLGSWTNVSIYHDNHYYSGMSTLAVAGDPIAMNCACTNKIWLAIDGNIVGGIDGSPQDWTGLPNAYGQLCPPNSRLEDANLPFTLTLLSGLYGRIDGTKITSNPISEAEVELAIRSNRLPPYFIPDVLFKSGPNSIFESGIIKDNLAGKDLHIGSYYNFSSPGYPGWDRGIIRNHLVFSGNYSSEFNTPYGIDLYSTRLGPGCLAIAEYSSSYNFINTSNEELGTVLTVDANNKYCSGCNDNSFGMLGWIYPRNTGTFFKYTNSNNLNRIELTINNNYQLVSDKYDSSDSLQYSHTGQTLSSGDWNYFYVNLIHTGVKSLSATGVTTSYIGSTSGYSSLVLTGTEGYVLYNTGSSFNFIGIDQSLFNIAIPHIYNSLPTTGAYWTTGNKGGRYQAVIENSLALTGQQIFDSYNEGYFILGPTTGNSNRYFSLAYHNTYDNIPKLQGITAYDNTPFKEVSTYSILYDTEQIDKVFGRTDSPIRLGNKVPENAINLARYSSPTHTVPSSVSTIDLSDSNVNNLINYKNGEYLIGDGVFTQTQLSGINSGLYTGMFDVKISGQVVSADVNITNCIISDPNMEEGYPAYYYYLVGRGQKYVQILGAYPHLTGELGTYSTGSIPETYIANLERVKQSLSIKNRKGEVLDKSIYPYDISISSYSPNIINDIVKNSTSIYLDNQSTVNTGSILQNGVFTVLLLLNKNRIEGESIFVHYDAYDPSSNEIYPGYKEIINPSPIFRERHDSEVPKLGVYDLNLNTNSYYDLCVYGINSGYSGNL